MPGRRRGRKQLTRRIQGQCPYPRPHRPKGDVAADRAESGRGPVSERFVFIGKRQDMKGEDAGGVEVSRSMPSALWGVMDDASWNALCDELDEALLPTAKIRRIAKYQEVLTIAAFVPLLAYTGIAIGKGSEGGFSIALFLVLLCAAVGGIVAMASYAARVRGTIARGLLEALDGVSRRDPDVSFKISPSLRYIEVCASRGIEEEDRTLSVGPSDDSGDGAPDPGVEATDAAPRPPLRSIDESREGPGEG